MKQEEEKKMEKIDQLDRKILRILSDNARVPFKEIAARCGVSRAAVHQRVQRLIDNNVFMAMWACIWSMASSIIRWLKA